MSLKIDGDELKSIKALVVSLNGVFKIIDEKLDGLVDSIKTLSDEQILGAVKVPRIQPMQLWLSPQKIKRLYIRLMTKLNILVNWLKKKIGNSNKNLII